MIGRKFLACDRAAGARAWGPIAAVLLAFPVHSQTSTLIDLGAGVSAYGINASGQITGCIPATDGSGATHAFIYTTGISTDLGTLGGSSSCGFALNAAGQVTGYADVASGAAHAFLYGNGTMSDLGAGGAYETVGTSINASGSVVGYSTPSGITPYPSVDASFIASYLQGAGGGDSAFLYQNGVMTQILSRPSLEGGFAGTAINDGGAIAGLFIDPECTDLCPLGSAFIYLNGSETLLADAALFFTAATAINHVGQVVGYGEDGYGHNHGLIFADGGVTDLGNDTQAYAINSSGQVVGVSNVGLYNLAPANVGPAASAFLYSGGKMSALNIPGAVPSNINDSGWIIANDPTLQHAYLLRPSSVSLAPTGLSFGNQTIGVAGSSNTAACGVCAVTLTNGTSAAIALSGLAVSGPFAEASSTCSLSLAAGASCMLDLTFTPMTPDTSVGAVSITAGGTTYAALLSGVGTIVVTLKSSASSVAVGTPFTLTWSSTAGSSCQASGGALAPNNAPLDAWTGTKPSSGSLTLSESQAATLDFTLTCTDGAQTATAHAPVSIAAPTVSLTASPLQLDPGQAATLTWTSSHAASCSASGGASGDGWTGPKATSGSASVREASPGTFTYTMTCTSGGSSGKASVKIVDSLPRSGGGGAMDEISILWLLATLGLTAFATPSCPRTPYRAGQAHARAPTSPARWRG